MQYKTILFDLDGTLTNSEKGILNCVEYALKQMNRESNDREELKCFIGPPLQKQFAAFCQCSDEDAAQAVSYYRERYEKLGIFENEVYDGIPELLELLKNQGRRLAVATSKPTIFTNQILEHFNLNAYFDVVVGSEMDNSRVEKAEVIEEVLRELYEKTGEEIVKSEILMVGDREHDIIGAKKCQLASMGIRYGFAKKGELEEAGADIILDTITQMMTFFS